MKNKKILHCDYNPDDSKYYCSTKTKYGLLFPEKCELILKYEELYNYIKEHQDDYIYELPILIAHDFEKKLRGDKVDK